MAATTWYAHVAVTLTAPGPRVEIKPAGMVSELADSLHPGGRTYGDAEFARRFRVQTTAGAYAKEIIDGGLAAFLCTADETLPLTVERGEIRTWLPNPIGDEGLLPVLDFLCAAADAIRDPDDAADTA
jgi:hypothetical protein